MDIKEITEKLEKGVKEIFTDKKYTEYLKTAGKFHQYSVNNTILIYLQFPSATYIAGYKDWQNKFRRQVRKGEKAIRIIAPIPHRRKETDLDGNETERHWNTYKTCSVFDISQTDGEELPSITSILSGKVENYQDIKKRLHAIAPVPIVQEQIEGEAYGYFSQSRQKIAIREGLPELQEIKTTIHEIAHSILHCKNGEQVCATRGEREVQAESVAYVVCCALGLDTSDYSFGYIAGWSRDKDTKTLTTHLTVIQKTAKSILEKLTGESCKNAA